MFNFWHISYLFYYLPRLLLEEIVRRYLRCFTVMSVSEQRLFWKAEENNKMLGKLHRIELEIEGKIHNQDELFCFLLHVGTKD